MSNFNFKIEYHERIKLKYTDRKKTTERKKDIMQNWWKYIVEAPISEVLVEATSKPQPMTAPSHRYSITDKWTNGHKRLWRLNFELCHLMSSFNNFYRFIGISLYLNRKWYNYCYIIVQSNPPPPFPGWG